VIADRCAALVLLAGAALLLPCRSALATDGDAGAGEDFSFDVSAYEKKPFEWGGFFELRGLELFNDRDSRLYAPPPGSEPTALTHQAAGLVDLHAKARKGVVTGHAHLRGKAQTGQLGYAQELDVFRLSLAAQPHELFNLELGMTNARWGKGYAINPIAFVDRPKDPGDPEEALQGFVMARAEFTKSFQNSPLRNISLTVVLLPVHEGINEDFGRLGHDNLAGRLALLLLDTDIELVALAGGSRSVRYGLGLSRNITPELELHAEAVYQPDLPRPVLAADQQPYTEKTAATQVLGGLRYLSPQETTYIVEYFFNSAGASPEQLDLAYDQVAAPGPAGELLASFTGPFPMQQYLYLRVSQKEPFDVLDFFPSAMGMVNLVDGSFSLTPELLYKGITNLELRGRATLLIGKAGTSFGERAADARVELRARYFF